MSSAGSTYRLGVDLGTTWTAAAVARAGAGAAEPLPLGEQGAAMPSVVALDGEAVVAGDAAERRLLADPTVGVREPKRRLGDTTPFVIAGTPYGADALMGHLLRHTVDRASEAFGAAPAEVVVTHPANWGEYKLDLLREAARIADVAPIRLLTEPEAAAAHYIRLGRLAAGQTVAVYDFGGGTFDVAVVRCTDTGTEVLGEPEGLERLGGLDLDEAVFAHVDRALDGQLRELDPDDPAVRRGVAQLRVECTKAKEALSSDSETTIPVAFPGLVTDLRMTRDEFEAAIRGRVGDTLTTFDRAIASAGVGLDDLAGVLLVGGSSRIPLINEQVAAHTGRPVLLDADAKLVVALGAASAAAIASGGASGSAVSQKQETPMDERTEPAKDDQRAAASGGAGVAKKAAAKRAAGGGKGSPDGKGGKKLKGRHVAAGAAGAAAAAGVAAAGVAAAGALTNDDTDTEDPPLAPPPDDSMDAFDDVATGATGGGGSARGFGGGGGRGGGGSAGGGSAGGAAGVAAAGVAGARPGAPSEPAYSREAAAAVTQTPDGPALVSLDEEVARVRAQLQERLETWEPPEGADPEAAAELRGELAGLIDRFQPMPGQTVDQALADLRDRFDDKVDDFARDIRIEALIAEAQQQREAADGLRNEVDELKAALEAQVEAWEPPAEADPEAAEELRADLLDAVRDYDVLPGVPRGGFFSQIHERMYNLVQDFSDRVVAVPELQGNLDGVVNTAIIQPIRYMPGDEDFRPEVSMPASALTGDGEAATTDQPAEGVMTAPAPGGQSGLTDVFDEFVSDGEAAVDAEVGMIADPVPGTADAALDDDVLGSDVVGAPVSAQPDQDMTVETPDYTAQVMPPDPSLEAVDLDTADSYELVDDLTSGIDDASSLEPDLAAASDFASGDDDYDTADAVDDAVDTDQGTG
jgi:actin-like ATPase involved in cell morphogenesis